MLRNCAPTFDEPAHLAAGYLALTTSIRHVMARDHGPAAQMWDALPLVALRPDALRDSPAWGRLFEYGETFLYKNIRPAERMLSAARAWSLLSWTTLLALTALSWAMELGGAPAAAFCALLLAFCPIWISNASLVTTDAGTAFFYFALFRLLASSPRSIGRRLTAGICIGLAMASKLNMIVALPIAFAAWWLEPMSAAERRAQRPGLLVALAAAFATVAVLYHGRIEVYFPRMRDTLFSLTQSRRSFLWGRYSTTGWLWYFPFALAVKSPVPFLVAAAAGLGLVRRIIPARQRSWLLVAPAAYFAAACAAKTQIGVRHVLPVVPFLLVLGGCAAGAAWRRGGAVRTFALALSAWLAVGVLRAGPDYLAYFNEFAGGPDGGRALLAESNIDWGQALKPLAAELKRRGNPVVHLCYFGAASPTYYGVRYRPVGQVVDVLDDGRRPDAAPGAPYLLAVSETNLQSVYYDDKTVFDWLRNRRPDFVAGHSIFLYDLTGDPDGRRRVEALTAPGGKLGASVTSTL